MKHPSPSLSKSYFKQQFWSKSARFWVLAALGWTMIAIIAASSAFVALKGQSYTLWSQLFSHSLVYFYLWALLSPLAYLMVTRLPFKVLTAPWVIILHLVFLSSSSLILPMLVYTQEWREWVMGERAISFHTMNTISYCFVIAACLIVKYYRLARFQEKEARELSLHNLQLENQLNLARIDHLRMQINPHFLFNTLNSIGALVETQRNDEAYETIETLGALLKHALLLSNEQQVPLKNELAFVELYLSLEKLRYGDRVCFTHFIDPSSLQISIPALILQPLVENSIKHAVSATSRPVNIYLKTHNETKSLSIELSDDGPNLGTDRIQEIGEQNTAAEASTGIGLKNVSERLKLLYKGKASFSAKPLSPNGFSVKIQIPHCNNTDSSLQQHQRNLSSTPSK